METYEELVDIIKNCGGCELSKSRTHAVPGEGPLDAKIIRNIVYGVPSIFHHLSPLTLSFIACLSIAFYHRYIVRFVMEPKGFSSQQTVKNKDRIC